MRVFLVLLLVVTSLSCEKKKASDERSVSCSELTGTAWTPNISGASSSNHDDSSISVSKTTQSGSAVAVGLYQAFSLSGSNVATFTFNVATDLGTMGSVQLISKMTTDPSLGKGTTLPTLVSLTDPAGNEYVQLGSSCLSDGVFKTTCSPGTTSIFLGSGTTDRAQQFQSQWLYYTDSVVTFPTCNWSSGSTRCPFASDGYFSGGKLRTGTYTAKYLMVVDGYSSISSSGNLGTMQLTTLMKSDNNAGSSKGVFDVNVVIVGNNNIQASRSDKGKQNLDALFSGVYNHYYSSNASSMGIKMGSVKAYEWNCASGGDTYLDLNLEKAQLYSFLRQGSQLVDPSTEGKAINLFFTSTISAPSSGLTILGIAGGIGGPAVNATAGSGVAVSTFEQLATFNPSCGATCPETLQDKSFRDMAQTISHEMGHYFGLNHLSESTGASHDPLPDTPICTAKSGSRITLASCLTDSNVLATTGSTCPAQCPSYNSNNSFCATKLECQFNHIMWYTTKNYGDSATGDGNLFSNYSGLRVGYGPLIR